MLWPRYKRIEKLNAKLSDEDVKEIKILRQKGISGIAIAKKYNVTHQTIYKICGTEEQRIERNKRQKLYYKPGEKHNRTQRRTSLRKRKLQKNKINLYHKLKRKEFDKTHPGYRNNYRNNWRRLRRLKTNIDILT